MQQLNQRQQKILDFISSKDSVSNSEIVKYLGNKVSRYTVLRDLRLLQKEGLIKKTGKGRQVRYLLVPENKINAFYDPDLYFKRSPDERALKTDFNIDIANNISNLLSAEETSKLEYHNSIYREKIKKAEDSFIKKEIERLAIEFSWKSSRIEGNTYSLIDTEILIKERQEAQGHSREEAIMILNHKNTIDYIFQNSEEFRKVNLAQIKEVHQMLIRGLGVKNDIRSSPVRIIGTRYVPIEGRTKIIEALQYSIDKINSLKNPFAKALGMVLMISYIQPFDDGNKRTARTMGNAILLAHNACPLSYRGVDEAEYKKAIILFYEQNSARYFKELFIDQFQFAVENYF